MSRDPHFVSIVTVAGITMLQDLSLIFCMYRCAEAGCKSVHALCANGSLELSAEEAARVRGLLTNATGPVSCDDLVNHQKENLPEGQAVQ